MRMELSVCFRQTCGERVQWSWARLCHGHDHPRESAPRVVTGTFGRVGGEVRGAGRRGLTRQVIAGAVAGAMGLLCSGKSA
jgi:hypothetical protein